MTALRSAMEHVHDLAGATPAARRQEMVTYLLGRPEFEAAEANEDGSVWARFTDGRLLIITSQDPITAEEVDEIVGPEPAPASASQPAAAPPDQLPKSLQARFYLGGERPTYPTIIHTLKNMVAQRNYVLAPNAGDGGIDDLKRVSSDAIFYWSTHGGGGKLRNGQREYAVATATEVSRANDARYEADLDSLRLAYAFGVRASWIPSWVPGQEVSYYGVTAAFVTRYMSFPKDSFIWLGACSALASLNKHFVDALIAAGAGVVAAWDSALTAEADYQAGIYVFDRMLGLNTRVREGPPQRPFDYASIKANMAPYDTDIPIAGAPQAHLLFVSGGRNAPAGLLAPSIKNMYMDEERDLLVLSGKFGSEMGTAQVAGIDRTVESWTEDTVKIRLPATGTGTAGEVVVFSRGRRSNVRPLTEWRGEFIWTFINTTQPNLQWAGLIRAHIRADVHDYRDEHRETPDGRLVRFACARDTNGEVTGSGDHTSPGGGGGTTSWRGTAHLVSRLQSPGPNTIDCMGEIDTDAKVLRLFLIASAQQGMTITSEGQTFPFPAVWAHPGEAPLQLGAPLPAMVIPMSQTWNITDGHRALPGVSPTQELDWGVIQPTTRTAPADSMAR